MLVCDLFLFLFCILFAQFNFFFKKKTMQWAHNSKECRKNLHIYIYAWIIMSLGALLILGFTENLLVVSFLSLFHSEARPCPNLTWRRPWTSISSVHHIYLIWLFIAIDVASATNTKLQHNSKGRWFWKKGFSCINKWLVQLESEVCFFFIDPQLANFTCMPKTIPSQAPNRQGPSTNL
jgi:hypothetical protein